MKKIAIALGLVGCGRLGSAPLVLTEVPTGIAGKALIGERAAKRGCAVDDGPGDNLTLRCPEGTIELAVVQGPPTLAVRCVEGKVADTTACKAVVRGILMQGEPAALEREAVHTPAALPPSACPTDSVLVAAGDAPFCTDRTEVTVASYRACVAAGKCAPPESTVSFPGFGPPEPMRSELSKFCNATRADREDHPMNCVDQAAAESYCRWKGGRIATEEEWEQAARGAGGPLCWDRRDSAAGTCAVGSFAEGASAAGALDMLGNVWEWTRGDRVAIARGGGWTNFMPSYVKTTARWPIDPKMRLNCLGIRCVYDAKR